MHVALHCTRWLLLCLYFCSCVNNVHTHLCCFLHFSLLNYLKKHYFFPAGYSLRSCSTFGTSGSSVKLLLPPFWPRHS
uniref:Putative secreted protein n=1 Tax=Amblyomma triste TaxID=251400 RepID=A0A023G108_AMBTT